MPIPDRPGAQALIERFDDPAVRSIILLGSHSRGQAGPFSDIDLLRVVSDGRSGEQHSHFMDDHLVVVSDVDLDRIETWFAQPALAVQTIAGLRDGVALVDRENTFTTIKVRAENFVWDDRMHFKALEWVCEQMAGWAEEVHKGLNGLASGHTGTLIHARHGLSWGMIRIVQVYHALLCRSDNDFFDAVTLHLGSESEWTRELRRAFAVESLALDEQVRAGLRLYVLTSRHVEKSLLTDPQNASVVRQTVRRIESTLLQ